MEANEERFQSSRSKFIRVGNFGAILCLGLKVRILMF